MRAIDDAGGPVESRPLEEFVARCRDAEGVALEWLEPGTVLLVETCNSRYRLLVVDGPKRRVIVQGGAMFLDATPVRFEGATAGGAVKLGWILLGLSFQVVHGRRRIRSSAVRGIEVEHVPSQPRNEARVA